MNPNTAELALAVSFVSLLTNAVRMRTAEKNNTIAGSAPWAQVLMSCIQSEVGLCIREQNALTSFFVRSFETIERKNEARRDIDKTRDDSARNIEFLQALYGEEKEIVQLTQSRAGLSKVYDSFLESQELRAPDSARQVFQQNYRAAYIVYMRSIRGLSLSVSVGRAGLERKKKWFGFLG